MKSLEIDVRLQLLKHLGSNPVSLKNLADYLSELNGGAWAQSFVDCIYQYSWHHEPDLYDKYILFDAIQQLDGAQGSYLAFQVKVLDSPYADREAEANNHVLECLPSPFKAKFIGGNQGEDGYFSWESPVHSPIKIGDTVYWLLLDANTLPLEVGTNSSFKFKSYMSQRGGVARWPYGSSYITIFINRALIKAHTGNSSSFKELLSRCTETIDECLSERNPWERWKAEVIAGRPLTAIAAEESKP